jgi:hypothetical protein
VRLPILAVFVMLATPAFSVELFRYSGAAKDGGTLEYVFEAEGQNSPNAVTKEKAAEIAADDDILPCPSRRSGNAGVSNKARSVLARLLLGHGRMREGDGIWRYDSSFLGWNIIFVWVMFLRGVLGDRDSRICSGYVPESELANWLWLE